MHIKTLNVVLHRCFDELTKSYLEQDKFDFFKKHLKNTTKELYEKQKYPNMNIKIIKQ